MGNSKPKKYYWYCTISVRLSVRLSVWSSHEYFVETT